MSLQSGHQVDVTASPTTYDNTAAPMHAEMNVTSGIETLSIVLTFFDLMWDQNIFCKEWILTGEVKRK